MNMNRPGFIVKKVPDYIKQQARNNFGWKNFFYTFVILTMVVAGLNLTSDEVKATAVIQECQTGVVTLLNGGFETPNLSDASWNIFPSGVSGLGWTVGWAGGVSGAPEVANLELHRGVNGWVPAEGSQYAELDTDWDGPSGSNNNEQASVVIYQNVAVVPYATYQLSFKLSPRPGTDSTQNNVRTQFGSIDQTNSLDGSSNTNTVWSNFSYPMVNDNSSTKSLQFTDLGVPDSFGMFIDDVRLELTQCPARTGDLTICKYNDLNKDGIKDEDDTPLQWPFTVNYPGEGGDLSTGTNGETGCVTINDLSLGEYIITEAGDNAADDNISWVKSNPSSGSQTINLTAEGATATFLNYAETVQPDTTFHFIKAVCPSYSDVAGNIAANNVDATGGQYVNFSNYQEGPSFSPAVTKPINPSEIPSSCVRQAGWQFKYSIDQAQSQQASFIGPTNSNGEATVKLSQMVPEQQSHIKSGGQLWVSEDLSTKPNTSAFAALRCYADAVNGDNLEYISLGTDIASYPSDVYCIAYNVGETEQPTGSIHGYKWNDLDGDGERGEERLLSGWTVFIDEDDDGKLDDGETSMVTSDSEEHFGWYWFENLPYGNYSICEVNKPGWTQTYPKNCHSVTLPDGNSGGMKVSLNAVSGPEYNFGNHENNICTNNTVVLDEVPVESLASWTVGNTGGNPIFSYSEVTSPYDESTAIETSVVGDTYQLCPSQYLQKSYMVNGNTTTSVLKAYLAFASSMDEYNFPYVTVYLYDSQDALIGYQVYYGKGVISGIYAGYAAADPAHYTELSAASGDLTMDLSKIGSNKDFSKVVVYLSNYACVGTNSVTFDHLRLVNTCEGTPENPTLNVTISTGNGDGSGRVTSSTSSESENQINCQKGSQPENCSAVFASGTVVTLTAIADEGSTFTGTWSGACSGDNPVCVITVDSNKSVNAHFSLASSGGGGGGSSGGGGGSSILSGPITTGAVLGATTFGPGLQMPEAQVQGVVTELPRTGLPFPVMVITLALGMVLANKKFSWI